MKRTISCCMALLLLLLAVCLPAGTEAAERGQQNRQDGYTNDTEISAAKYPANQHAYHSIFQMGLAGPGLTAWDYATGRDVNVAVFDEGFDLNDKELEGKIKGYYNAKTDKEGAENISGGSHGTSCAKILGAAGNNRYQSAGVAYDANLYLVQVGGNDETWRQSLIRGIEYAAANHCRVISASVSDPVYHESVEKAITEAYCRSGESILFVASGGNTGKEEYRYPSAYQDAFGISALNYSSKTGKYTIANSTYSDRIDMAAPGGTTSAATPYVAGTAALLFSANPALTAAQCAQILRETATDAGTPGYDKRYGYGIVNPLAAVQRAKLGKTSIGRRISGVSPSYNKKLSSRTFWLSPKTEGSGTFSYSSSSPSVASVNGNGKVTLHKTGVTKITVSIGKSGIYQKASFTATLTVTDKKLTAAIKKVKLKKLTAKKRTVTVRWKRNKKASGYQVWIAKNKTFQKGRKKVYIKKNSVTKKTFKKLAKKKKYYVKVRAYKKVGKTKIFGKFSKVKSIKTR